MSQKDYILIAVALRSSRPAKHLDTWRAVCETIADVLSADDARFSRAVFLSTCGAYDD